MLNKFINLKTVTLKETHICFWLMMVCVCICMLMYYYYYYYYYVTHKDSRVTLYLHNVTFRCDYKRGMDW
jgi:hypothetical protein